MESLGQMVDMRRTPEETAEYCGPPTPADAPAYPYGLCISLCDEELEKLGCELSDFDVGDLIHFHAFAVVTSKSANASVGNEAKGRVELQITNFGGLEDENDENDEEEDRDVTKKLYA